MAVKTKLEPLGKDLSILIDDTLSPRAQSEAFAGFARLELRDAQEVNLRVLGGRTRHKTFVDGRAEAPLESVRPDGGRIVFRFDLLADVLVFVAETLAARSPASSGRYRRSHQLFADGVLVAGAGVAPAAREYVFLNPLPYARKIEAGLMRMRVPGTDHVYEQTRQAAARRFGNVATFRLTYRGVTNAERVPALVVMAR